MLSLRSFARRRVTLATIIWGVAFGVGLVLFTPVAAQADTDQVLYRIFLKDGSTLVSYGEFVRVDDRVVFSFPLELTQDEPKLQLVSIPTSAVNWNDTDRYRDSARYARYVATRAETDFAAMSSDVARALNDIALTPDPATRLQIAERARHTLLEWPRTNLGYRSSDIRQIVALLDEVVSELRLAQGGEQFALSLVAVAEPPPLMPLLPAPSLVEIIGQALLAAQVTSSPAERLSLLQSAVGLVDRAGVALAPAFVKVTRDRAMADIADELQVERSYADLSKSVLAVATERAAAADVRGVERVVRDIPKADERLGKRRPEAVTSLLLALEAKLDSARRLRLARDQWQFRRPAYRRYIDSTRSPISELTDAKLLLEDIKALAGPSREQLATLEKRVGRALARFARVTAPPGMQAVHDLLSRALEFADNAARFRTRAVASGELPMAWDASSAAAASLMMLAQARQELERFLKIPELQ